MDELKNLSSADMTILRWHLLRRPAQTCPYPVPTVWFLLGGRGCVAAGTPIWDPVAKSYRSIEKMTEPGWVLTTEGPVIASPSYIKGVAPLFRLETETGDAILATAEHRFLTQRGYVSLQEIEPDDEILSLDPSKLSLQYTEYQKVVSITPAGVQEFYDLHVPGPNNYLAAGMFHHNSGKTYTAANHIFDYSHQLPFTVENKIVYVALIGSIFDDVKHTMVEGKSGLLNIIPEEDILKWNRTVGELKFKVHGPNGAYREVWCNTYTSEKPDKLRGPNTHLAWIDEFAKFKDADVDPTQAGTTWNNMMMGLRLGTKPHVIVTGTPTPCKLTKYLRDHPDMLMSHMTTMDNLKNLPKSFADEFMRLRKDSRTYRQEVLAEILFDNPDAIFSQESIEENRSGIPEEEDKVYKVLGYDPSASSAAEADECGIMLCAYTPEIKQATLAFGGRPVVIKPVHAYILKDLSGHYTPNEQTQLVIQTVLNEKVTDLVFEQNQGVEFVMAALEQALKDNTIEFKVRKRAKSQKTDYGIVKRFIISGLTLNGESFKFTVYAIHATKGKKLRAEMISGRYDSNQIHHPLAGLTTCEVQECSGNLENQMTMWSPDNTKTSPDRLDAMVYCMLHIFSGFMLTNSKVTIARPQEVTQAGSEHGAVQKRRGLVSIYSGDIHQGPQTNTGNYGLSVEDMRPGLEELMRGGR